MFKFMVINYILNFEHIFFEIFLIEYKTKFSNFTGGWWNLCNSWSGIACTCVYVCVRVCVCVYVCNVYFV